MVNEETKHRYHLAYTEDGVLTVVVEVKELNGRKYILGDNDAFTLLRTDGSDYINNLTDDDSIPGTDQIGMDMDNIYGFDSNYTGESLYSMDSAHQITVDKTIFGEAVFTFTGTGFNVLALSSNTTGTITVDIYSTNFLNKQGGIYNHGATRYRSYMVDTYYGYTYGDDPSTDEVKAVWYVTDSHDPNALYHQHQDDLCGSSHWSGYHCCAYCQPSRCGTCTGNSDGSGYHGTRGSRDDGSRGNGG